jgi:adenylate kinase
MSQKLMNAAQRLTVAAKPFHLTFPKSFASHSSSVAQYTTTSCSSSGGTKRRGLPAVQVENPSSSTIVREFQTDSRDFHTQQQENKLKKDTPGSLAFAECEKNAVTDLFFNFAAKQSPSDNEGPDKNVGGVDSDGKSYLCLRGVRELLSSIGERPDEQTLRRMFSKADRNNDGRLDLQEFLHAADEVLSGAPARIVLVVGGPGSGKGILSDRLAEECGIVHLSSGDLLREEVERDTPLGRECADIMKRGELVSSAVITALIRRRMRAYPGRRVLLDGFPRSLENAHDFLNLCGKPELALHLDCDDTILMERIMNRSREGGENGNQRLDDNFETAIQRLRTYHKYHKPTMDWLREQHVPIVNLDCSMTPDNVWNQLLAIGRLMRPAAEVKAQDKKSAFLQRLEDNDDDDVRPA